MTTARPHPARRLTGLLVPVVVSLAGSAYIYFADSAARVRARLGYPRPPSEISVPADLAPVSPLVNKDGTSTAPVDLHAAFRRAFRDGWSECLVAFANGADPAALPDRPEPSQTWGFMADGATTGYRACRAAIQQYSERPGAGSPVSAPAP